MADRGVMRLNPKSGQPEPRATLSWQKTGTSAQPQKRTEFSHNLDEFEEDPKLQMGCLVYTLVPPHEKYISVVLRAPCLPQAVILCFDGQADES